MNAEVLLDRVLVRLNAGRPDLAERVLERLRRDAPDSRARSLAEIEWLRAFIDPAEDASSEAEAAVDAALRTHVKTWPDDADALHLLGARCLDAGQVDEAVQLWLRVRVLDVEADRREDVGNEEEMRVVFEVAEAVVDALEDPFKGQLAGVPIVVEDRPSEDLVASGFDPRAYGLFEGPDHAWASSLDAPPLPSRIVLFANNLLADFGDREELEEQVEITVLHEAGHYFGLDEDDLARMGLD